MTSTTDTRFTRLPEGTEFILPDGTRIPVNVTGSSVYDIERFIERERNVLAVRHAERVQAELSQALKTERARIAGALKKLGIRLETNDSWRNADARLERKQAWGYKVELGKPYTLALGDNLKHVLALRDCETLVFTEDIVEERHMGETRLVRKYTVALKPAE